MFTPGLTHQLSATVTTHNTALAMGSGDLEVFATPAMIALMEGCAAASVAPALEPGSTTVGVFMEAHHIAASPIGMEVRAESRLMEVEGRKLTFEITAWDSRGQIGRALHRRVMVDRVRFMDKCRG